MSRGKYTVEKMCSLLQISTSGFYDWKKRKFKESKCKKIELKVAVIFEQSKQTYGSPRIQSKLKDQGIYVSQSTVARAMQSLGILARPRKKYVATTDSKHDFKVFKNILNRDFKATRLNEKWVSDISYIPSKKGWLYLTTIIDLADRMVVAWNLSKDMSCANTTSRTLQLSLKRRKIDRPLILHSDRGVQYACAEFRSLVKTNKLITQSMSRKGNCWDNAVAESFFKTLKTEWTNKFVYKDLNEAKKSIFDYIERWYNTQRKHSAIDYLSPLQKHNLFFNRTAA